MNVFFVCGAPKSGTTWLQRILDAHPEISCSGEGHFVERFTAPMAQVARAYNDGLAMEAEQVYEGRPSYAPVEQAALDGLARTFILERLAARAGPGVRWIGDKTPRYTHHLGALHRIFAEARFIHIVRDPRDVAVSRLGHNARVGHADALVAGSDFQRRECRIAAEGWLEAVARVDAFAASHAGRVHELRYGDLHVDPLGEMGRLFRFLGVAEGRPLLEAVGAATSFEALTGRKPGQENPASFLRKGVPGDWKNRLPADIAAMIVATCGEAMRAKGFLPAAEAARSAA